MKNAGYLMLVVISMVLITAASSCTEEEISEPEASEPEAIDPEFEAADKKNQVFGEVSETAATGAGEIEIDGLGTFSFDPQKVETVRKDIFREGYFSIFDILVYLAQDGQIDMDYYFDEEMNTHIIDSLDGRTDWWYSAYYDGGWLERSVYRMDHYPYKDEMFLKMVKQPEERLESIYNTYRDEIRRKDENGGKIIVPEVIIEGKNDKHIFEEVEVTAHNLRSDMFQPVVVTAIDTILSLAEKGEISYDLQWYESIGTAGVVKSYWVNRINEDESQGRCGFVYEAGDELFYFFNGNHNHIPSDIRTINSPNYVKYFWICI